MCEDVGIILAYLPPYLPDLNAIQKSFARLKHWIKRIVFYLNSFKAMTLVKIP